MKRALRSCRCGATDIGHALVALRRCQSGATAIEYALIATLIAVAIIAGVAAAGGQLGILYNRIQTEVASALS